MSDDIQENNFNFDYAADGDPMPKSKKSEIPQPAPLNILKCSDDARPLFFRKNEANTEGKADAEFVFNEGSQASWIQTGNTFGRSHLRARIEPWLTSLCQSEHFSLLIGSGLSNSVHQMATGALLPGMSEGNFGAEDAIVKSEAKRTAMIAGREQGNIEDQIRVANELIRGLEILGTLDPQATKRAEALKATLKTVMQDFADSIQKGERNVVDAADVRREEAFNYLVSFLMTFASRSGTRDRLHIFTTNYDRFIEAGADVAGMRLLDRFVGALCPIFRSSRLDLDLHYNPPGIRGEPRYLEGVARISKLHGSLDWIDRDNGIVRAGIPFGSKNIASYISDIAGSDASRLMIYPNAAKDRETAQYPYVELVRDFAAASCRPNHTLATFGYGFGDDHLNRIVEDMLTIPSTHLVVMSFGDPLNRIMQLYEKVGRPAQITLLIGNHIGEFRSLVDTYLPKPAIDRTTFRMTELLKARWGLKTQDKLPEAPSKEKSE